MVLLKRHGLTPDQVDALDPDFLEELQAADRAENDHQELERKRSERRKNR